VAVSTLNDRLLISGDFKYLMYAEAFESIDTTVIMNGEPRTNHTITNWKDAYAMLLGAEFAALPVLRLRAGYELVTSATPEDYAKNAMAPPGVSHGFTLGVGLEVVDRLSVDVAGTYIAYETKVETATPDNAGVGTYGSNTGQIGLSATYRM
jgi:long-subunit fatty acid transport protein